MTWLEDDFARAADAYVEHLTQETVERLRPKERPWGPTATRRKLEAALPRTTYDPDSGLSRAEQERFHAWIARRARPQVRNELPRTSWMDAPYPYGKGSLPSCGF